MTSEGIVRPAYLGLLNVKGGIIVAVGGGPGDRRNGVRTPTPVPAFLFLGDFLIVIRSKRALIRLSRFDRNILLSVVDRTSEEAGFVTISFLASACFLTTLLGAVAETVDFFVDLLA
jgi:hypothetical protein